MVSALVPGVSGPWPGKLCCVLGQDTKLSQCHSPPRSINGYRQIVGEYLTNCGRMTCDGLASRLDRGSRNTPSRFMLQKLEVAYNGTRQCSSDLLAGFYLWEINKTHQSAQPSNFLFFQFQIGKKIIHTITFCDLQATSKPMGCHKLQLQSLLATFCQPEKHLQKYY